VWGLHACQDLEPRDRQKLLVGSYEVHFSHTFGVVSVHQFPEWWQKYGLWSSGLMTAEGAVPVPSLPYIRRISFSSALPTFGPLGTISYPGD